MKKRSFLRSTGTVIAGAAVLPIISCKEKASASATASATAEAEGPFSLPPLPYGYDALAPHIGQDTMTVHHDKHHAGYVHKLNAAIKDTSWADQSIDEIMASISPEDTAVRNNGGGHYNHDLFWKVMTPNSSKAPKGDLADAINGAFGSFDMFKEEFSKAAKTRFGSGWAWLCKGVDGQLFVDSTPNQDNPMMKNIVEKTGHPLLGIDVWEHAYYLNYQNRRGDYVSNFFDIINWDEVGKRLG